jgi:hypothetical protein
MRASAATDIGADGAFSFRELHDPEELVVLLRLRHRIYFEQQQYGQTKALALDLTTHDTRSRLYGVFRDRALIGGVRVVFRNEQPTAALFRALRVVAESGPEQTSDRLPSEEAFDLRASLGAEQAALVDAELSRLTLERTLAAPWVVRQVIMATLAAVESQGCRLYLYSCASEIARSYARITNPRVTLAQHAPHGIASDGFVFPKPTVAAVATVSDSPYAATVGRYVRELRQAGAIVLRREAARSPQMVTGMAPTRSCQIGLDADA